MTIFALQSQSIATFQKSSSVKIDMSWIRCKPYHLARREQNEPAIFLLSEIVTIQLPNSEDQYLGSDNGEDISPDSTPIQLIKKSPGLTGEPGTVSFYSLEDPSKFIANDNFTIGLRSKADFSDPEVFANESTFIEHNDTFSPGSVAFESTTLPEHFIVCTDTSCVLKNKNDVSFDEEEASLCVILPEKGKKYSFLSQWPLCLWLQKIIRNVNDPLKV